MPRRLSNLRTGPADGPHSRSCLAPAQPRGRAAMTGQGPVVRDTRERIRGARVVVRPTPPRRTVFRESSWDRRLQPDVRRMSPGVMSRASPPQDAIIDLGQNRTGRRAEDTVNESSDLLVRLLPLPTRVAAAGLVLPTMGRALATWDQLVGGSLSGVVSMCLSLHRLHHGARAPASSHNGAQLSGS
jgi:hypothetical protein